MKSNKKTDRKCQEHQSSCEESSCCSHCRQQVLIAENHNHQHGKCHQAEHKHHGRNQHHLGGYKIGQVFLTPIILSITLLVLIKEMKMPKNAN
ncbi:protein of unknown function [endosymbiont DhMRE of Dentiscutata heterogama]|nr:protein of unknown function [endosymbiont DhMRE of Dentiscutata heterogama]